MNHLLLLYLLCGLTSKTLINEYYRLQHFPAVQQRRSTEICSWLCLLKCHSSLVRLWVCRREEERGENSVKLRLYWANFPPNEFLNSAQTQKCVFAVGSIGNTGPNTHSKNHTHTQPPVCLAECVSLSVQLDYFLIHSHEQTHPQQTSLLGTRVTETLLIVK